METTNFFSSIEQLNLTGVLHIIVTKGTDNKWVVSTLLENNQCGDNARKLIPPFNQTGTALELDKGYFPKIVTPLQKASGLMDNMEAFMKQLENVKQQSAMEKQKSSKAVKTQDSKTTKYNEALQKADELEKAGKYREAWMKVPDPMDYPEQAEFLRKRRSSLSVKFAPDLFAATEQTTPVEQVDLPEPEETVTDDLEGVVGADWDEQEEEY